MNDEQYKMLKTNGNLVIAYMLVNEKHKTKNNSKL
jgi:hypothetical protein